MRVFKVGNLVIIQHRGYYCSNETLSFDSLANKIGLYNSLQSEISTYKVSKNPPISLEIVYPLLIGQEICATKVILG